MAIFKLDHYPTIISSVPAGIVRELGPGITKVKVGDRVVTSTNIWPNKGDPKYGSQQRYVVADELEITLVSSTKFNHRASYLIDQLLDWRYS
jgi:NADPH:quinone reductase-like Zn-dependent oxidoreductase